jgi:glycosyltransferase involved in cell wall biosynthesis
MLNVWNQKNKIVYFITSLDYGGTQKNLYYIIKEIKENFGWDIIVVSLKKGGRYRNKIVSLGIKVYDLGLPKNFSFIFLFFLPYSIIKFIFVCIKYRPKIVHSFLFQANILARVIKIFLPKTKVFCSERVAEKQKLWQLKLLKFTNFLVDKIFVNSDELKEFVIKTQKVQQNKVLVVPNVIEPNEIKTGLSKTEVRNELGISDNDFFILSVGRLHKQKGFDLLVDIVKSFTDKVKSKSCERKYIFVVIGDGEEYGKLLECAKMLNVENYIKFLGYKENVYDYINACDLFLLTSYWEGSPNVVLESVVLKKPVVSTKVEGVAKILNTNFVVSLHQKREEVVREFVNKIFEIYSFEGRFDYNKSLSDKFCIEDYLPKNVIKNIWELY